MAADSFLPEYFSSLFLLLLSRVRLRLVSRDCLVIGADSQALYVAKQGKY